ncbi:hypothetical protein RV14_GL000937 [Enterococcus ratti]|uniref:Uncharacterized protein n=1 Tax=Enterococcus ratti TaxID=150033 RepID=A0A1L8WRT9_9ENTE|nr:hypothetical protein RV14_GL000937 [Enterococcus ratti]
MKEYLANLETKKILVKLLFLNYYQRKTKVTNAIRKMAKTKME